MNDITSNQSFLSLMNHSKDVIICLSLDKKILTVNSAFEYLVGLNKSGLIGQESKQIFEKSGLDLLANLNVEDVLGGLPVIDMKFQCTDFKGSVRHILWSFLPLLKANHTPEGVIIVGRDRTEINALSEQVEQLDTIIRYAPDMIYWKDKNSIHLGCNDQFAEVAGFANRKDIVGKSDHDFPWRAQAAKYNIDDKEVIASAEARLDIEDIMPFSNGKNAIVITNKVPLRDTSGEVIGVLGIATDITARKHMEEDLRKSKEAAEAASRAKTMFLANMSHDIKTPIAGIISTAESLAHAIADPNLKSQAIDIEQSGLRLLELMIEVIEVSRLEVRETTRTQTRFQLKQLVNDIIQLIKPAIVDKPLKLKLQFDKKIPNFLLGDRWHLYRVILNLLSNAIKFTAEGSVTIKLKCLKKSKKEAIIEISIRDTGTGIPKEKQANIFDEFTRLTPSYEGIYKGTGLGLYIVKQFLEAMDGAVYLDSEEGKGSTFTCVIPFKVPISQVDTADTTDLDEDEYEISEPKKSPPVTLPNPPLGKGISILLVEDNVIAARATQNTLRTFGCEVDVANSGTEAVKLFKSKPYHLIYMDLGLPDIDGTEATREIRKLENGSTKVPIIALSAHVDKSIKLKCLDSGMTDVHTKPLLMDKAKSIFVSYFGVEG